MNERDVVREILDIARWAPSGDNTQPWRFEIIGAGQFRVHAHDTRDWCVYDLGGSASQIAVGALWESIVIAASAKRLEARVRRLWSSPDSAPVLDVRLVPSDTTAPDPLAEYLEKRVTQRRPFSRRPLQEEDRIALEASVDEIDKSDADKGPFRLLWIGGKDKKREMARLLFHNAHIRLTTKEAFEVHRRIIEWDASESPDRIPDRAIGLDPIALKAMRWAMQSWSRVERLNRYMGGTFLPRLQMDFLPALGCAAHFLLAYERKIPKEVDDYLLAGRAVQRLWLTAASLGVQFQPETTPLIFSRYVREGVPFSENEKSLRNAAALKGRMDAMFGPDAVARGVFMGRVGYGASPKARSVRKQLGDLLVSSD